MPKIANMIHDPFSAPLTWLPAGEYILEVVGKYPNPTYWNKMYWLRLETNGSTPATEPLAALQVSLGPNPTAGPLTLSMGGIPPSEGTLSVLDAVGRTVQSQALTGLSTYTPDLSGLPAGLYHLVLRCADGVGAWNVVKE